jgi:uncharacterized membrane protein YccC
MYTSAASLRFNVDLKSAFASMGPPLAFAIRLWASVCLALLIAFWLQLDNPWWAGTSAAVVCQPQLGASLRKGWFRMIGTVIGAATIVVLTACFPQDRFAFLGLLALWGGLCVFAASVLPNFASYAASLAGYTAAIIAADTLGATGGASSQVFMLAVWRASEICIGIVCGGIVLAVTDFGGARRRLADSLATLATEVTGGFTRTLLLVGPKIPDTQTERRELVRRVIALDPVIDQVLGESGYVRSNAPRLQKAVYGLLKSLDGWRGIAAHLRNLTDEQDRRRTEIIRDGVPLELLLAEDPASAARWIADPMAKARACEKGMRALRAVAADTPSLRLLADEAVNALSGILDALDGLALLLDLPVRSQRPAHGSFRLSVPDWLPALVNAARAFIAIGLVELFWIATAWPNGAQTIVFVAIAILLVSPKGDLAYAGAIAFALACTGSIVCAGIAKFALLPTLESFPGFCLALGLFLVPLGFAIALSQSVAAVAVLTGTAVNFLPLMTPTNPMSYDTVQFYNTALAVIVGCGVAALAVRLLPPLSPALRAQRLLALSLRDLRRLAIAKRPPKPDNFDGQMYGRIAALPDSAEPLQRAQLLATLSVGHEVMRLREMSPILGDEACLDAALNAIAQGKSVPARKWLARIDHRLASPSIQGADSTPLLRARARILVLTEALAQHANHFDAGAPA